jgi:hypothetical protein
MNDLRKGIKFLQLRMDLNAVLRSARKTQPYITTNSIINFSTEASINPTPQLFNNTSSSYEHNTQPGSPIPLQLGHIMDVVSH